MTTKMLAVVALAATMFAGCGADAPIAAGVPSAPSQASTLRGTSWVLQDVGGAPALSGVEATLAFADDGGVNGRASCNQFSGRAAISDSAIAFSPLAATRMACADPIMQQEQQYLDALGRAHRFELRGTTLLIFSTASTQPLQFAAR
jgi:heat shock protein HslJ